ncbi:MAG: DUF4126 domain-containing protein [Acidobacteria bacterium]|nr:DUF4126 domain-containing protein [Acidobacteriota bacterium]
MDSETLLSVIVGLGLSAACGFRVFVPLLVMSVASLAGHLTLSSGFEWIGSYPALLTFAVATVLEIAGYYIPWVDNFLDVIGAPAAVIAGIIAMASSVTDVSPFLRWSLAIIAGGGIAATFHALTGMTRAASSVKTAGLGNFILSTSEAAGATAFSILAIVLPLLGVALIAILLSVACWPGRAVIRKMRLKNRQGSTASS